MNVHEFVSVFNFNIRLMLVLALTGFCSFLTPQVVLGQEATSQQDAVATRSAHPKPDFKVLGQVKKIAGGFQFTEGPTRAGDGAVYFTDIPANEILVWRAGQEVSQWLNPSMHANGLMYEAGGKLLACQMDGQVVAFDMLTKQSQVLAKEFAGKRFNAPNDLVVDVTGGIYFTDPLYRAPEPLPQGIQAVYYVSIDGKVRRISGDLPAPNGIGLSPDGKSLYVAPSMSSEMLVFDVLAPGNVSQPRTFCRLRQKTEGANVGGDGIAVDTSGNVYFTSDTGVQVFSADGGWLETIEFPEQPANVAFAGSGRNELVVTARTGLYTVEVSSVGLEPNQLRIGGSVD